ncbi:uncharacterized protein LOC100278392 [Zea mays]|uniref:Uncharacterized protein n=1 Tax=Zea mays TaxID=4577 RepID=A0A804RMI3_MAIZE|nr:uncharacterized protein LOC100278392 [Zea mays]|eukprot:NP_001145158.2 uncharacterized protein LOC100278392 [Zea mays]
MVFRVVERAGGGARERSSEEEEEEQQAASDVLLRGQGHQDLPVPRGGAPGRGPRPRLRPGPPHVGSRKDPAATGLPLARLPAAAPGRRPPARPGCRHHAAQPAHAAGRRRVPRCHRHPVAVRRRRRAAHGRAVLWTTWPVRRGPRPSCSCVRGAVFFFFFFTFARSPLPSGISASVLFIITVSFFICFASF